jgi:acetoacetate decarboxylase
MTAVGQSEGTPRFAVLPDRFGPGLVGDVIRIPNNYTAVLPYSTDRSALEALLPAGMTVAGDPVVSFRFRRAEGIDWADGTSHFIGASAMVEVAGADGTRCRGMHFIIGWEDDAMATILGREIIGTVKLPASITFDHDVRGVDRCLLHHRGRPLLELVCRKTDEFAGSELEELRLSRREGWTIGYKALPSVDGTAVGEHYATAIPTRAELESAWVLDGDVTLYETTAATALWHHRAIQALRSLPLLGKLPGMLTVGVNSLDLAHARRLA